MWNLYMRINKLKKKSVDGACSIEIDIHLHIVQ